MTERDQAADCASSEGLRIPPEVAERLGYYVYLYLDPVTRVPFYVGKGKAGRVLAHLSEEAETRKCARIAELRAANREPLIDILAHGLPNEETALRIEAAVIDLLGLDSLTNLVRGWRSLQGLWQAPVQAPGMEDSLQGAGEAPVRLRQRAQARHVQ